MTANPFIHLRRASRAFIPVPAGTRLTSAWHDLNSSAKRQAEVEKSFARKAYSKARDHGGSDYDHGYEWSTSRGNR